MLSGMRAPEDSPKKTMGMPRSSAVLRIWPMRFMLITLEDAPLTVEVVGYDDRFPSSIAP